MFVDVGERDVGVVDHEGMSIFRVLKGASESYEVSVSERSDSSCLSRDSRSVFCPKVEFEAPLPVDSYTKR